MSKKNGKPKKPDGRRISRKLKPRQRKLLAHYTDPNPEAKTFGNGTKSAIAAGYSKRSAAEIAYETLRKPQVERELTRIYEGIGVTIEKLAKGVKQALNAKEEKAFIHQKTGNVVYSKRMIAHDVRLRAIRLAHELRGDFAPKEINISVQVLAGRLDAARRRERERMVQGVRVEEGENNTQEAAQLSEAPQAEEKTK